VRPTPNPIPQRRGEMSKDFRHELECLINRYSKENGSNTPDFVLADYLNDCLNAFDMAVNLREKYFGRIQ